MTSVGDISFLVDEVVLGTTLKVDRKGVNTVIGRSPTKNFIQVSCKVQNLNASAIVKKLLKGQYQLYFEFVNKVFLQRTEKRTIATTADLYLMEAIIILEDINLLVLMMEHMTKVLTMRERRHRLAYWYLLNNVFEYFCMKMGRGVPGTIKQAFSQITLVECEYSQVWTGTRKSPILELLDQKEVLKRQVEELTIALAGKDVELAILKAKLG